MQNSKFLALIWTIILTFSWVDSSSANSILLVAPDSQVSYSRALFKHWVDADKDGCDTRAEVLIEEATIKPKIGKKCALTGGSWLSPYDNKVQSKKQLKKVWAKIFNQYGAEETANTADRMKGLAFRFATVAAVSTGKDVYLNFD